MADVMAGKTTEAQVSGAGPTGVATAYFQASAGMGVQV